MLSNFKFNVDHEFSMINIKALRCGYKIADVVANKVKV